MQHTSYREVADAGATAETLSPAGLVRDATVLTLRGQVPVQQLSCDDQVITRHSGLAAVRSIEVVSLLCRAVYVIAGSLGHASRDKDTLLSAGQPVLLRDWRARAFTGSEAALVPAGDLADGEFVRDLGLLPLTLYRLRCDGPVVLYVDGMQLGTADCLTPRARSYPL